jgi:hypothetical protein
MTTERPNPSQVTPHSAPDRANASNLTPKYFEHQQLKNNKKPKKKLSAYATTLLIVEPDKNKL